MEKVTRAFFISTNPYKEKLMGKNKGASAPAINIEDGTEETRQEGPLDADGLRAIVAQALEEYGDASREKLIEEISAAVIEDIRLQVLDADTINQISAMLNKVLLAQTKQVAKELPEQFKEEMDKRKMGTGTKVAIVLGTAGALGVTYYLGSRSGAKKTRLEMG